MTALREFPGVPFLGERGLQRLAGPCSVLIWLAWRREVAAAGFHTRNMLQVNFGDHEHRRLIVMPMTTFILWLVSFLNSPVAGMSLQSSAPSVIPLVTAGGCPEPDCMLNGTRITGLTRKIAGNARAITLPSGELVTLR